MSLGLWKGADGRNTGLVASVITQFINSLENSKAKKSLLEILIRWAPKKHTLTSVEF